ncbi:LysR family transcriptional regulator [Gynuella sunshinyii]|uniref:Transcriptional regulator n=1 Tax=Gynuella sunshinyii YC6258 TaxID=1445510 RepID=A0A0C5VLV1_9GAMM|nr:LysR family transcriptional regulator [Gynuella sunshinyii]AJQ95697.1 transcriptional regulator [Gynuella sunshinyii YC6258]
MRFNKLDLNLLVALDVLLTEQNITRAAEKINLSPSAMSSALSRLRDYFSDDLLTPIGRRMVVTPLGENLIGPVRNVLNAIESTVLLQPEFDPLKTDRVFSFFTSDYTQMVLSPRLLSLAAGQQSTARFQFQPQVENPYEALERGEADFLIIPMDYVSPDHPSEVLYEEDFVCIQWQGSPFANQPMTLERYESAGHIVMRPDGVRYRNFFESTLEKHYDIQRRVVVTSYSFSVLPSMIIGTDYIATMHRRLAQLLAKGLSLVIHELPFQIPPMKQAMQWHQYRNNDPGLEWVKEMLRRAADSLSNPDAG